MSLGFARTILVAAFVAVLLPAALAADPRPEIGQVDRLQGAASARYEGTARALKPSDMIYLDDVLSTEAGARLLVRLADETELTLGEEAELVVDRFVYDPDGEAGSLVVRSLAGAFLFTGGLVEKASGAEVRIDTPVATLGIRGTTAWGGQIDGLYGIMVIDGTVTVATDAGQVTLGPGDGSSIADRAAPPGPIKRWAPEKVARARATVAFDPE